MKRSRPSGEDDKLDKKISPSSDANDKKMRQRPTNTHTIERPHRPLSAYNFFFQNERRRMIESSGTKEQKLGAGDLARTISSRWKLISGPEKAHYQRLAETEKQRYRQEMETWYRLTNSDDPIIDNCFGETRTSGGDTMSQERPGPGGSLILESQRSISLKQDSGFSMNGIDPRTTPPVGEFGMLPRNLAERPNFSQPVPAHNLDTNNMEQFLLSTTETASSPWDQQFADNSSQTSHAEQALYRSDTRSGEENVSHTFTSSLIMLPSSFQNIGSQFETHKPLGECSGFEQSEHKVVDADQSQSTIRILADSFQPVAKQKKKTISKEEINTFGSYESSHEFHNDDMVMVQTPIIAQSRLVHHYRDTTMKAPNRTRREDDFSSDESKLRLLALRLGPEAVDFIINTFLNCDD